MHTFAGKTCRVHINSDGSGDAEVSVRDEVKQSGSDAGGVSLYVAGNDLVQFARWLLRRVDGHEVVCAQADLLAAAAREYLNEATFPEWGETCVACDNDGHIDDCPYARAEAALEKALKPYED